MTYATSNPPSLVSQRVGANGGAVWIYKDGDALGVVAGVNYFSNAGDLGMKAGDRVIAINETDGIAKDLTAVAWTPGTAVGATASAVEPIAETSIALSSAGTGTIVIGDIITFDNDPDGNEYRVTTGDTDVSNGGTLVITPGLAAATAVGTAISVKAGVINMGLGEAGQLISSSASTRTLTLAEAGSTVLFDRAAGIVFTLPLAVVGTKFRFETTVSLTSNAYAIVTGAATEFIVGAVEGAIEAAATGETHFANGTTHVGISSNKTTTGGLIGGWLEMECLSATLWSIRGTLSCTATPATPFTT